MDEQIDRALMSALRRAKGLAAAEVDVRDCVDAERLAAWSSGALSGDEAAGVERHLATCVRCQDVAAVFAETAAPAVAAAVPASAPASKAFRWIAPLAAAAAVVVWVAWPRPNPAVMPAETMARVQVPQPRAETPPPAASPATDPAVVPPVPAGPAPATIATQGGTAAKSDQSARDAAEDKMKAVERLDRSLLQEQQRADPKAAPPQRAPSSGTSPLAAPPPPAPAIAPVPVSTPAPATVPPAGATPVIPLPPPAASAAPPPTAAREFRAPALAELVDPRSVVAQFTSAMPPGVAGGVVAGAGRGGAGRGGGGGGGAANRQITMDAVAVTPAVPHWRVLASGAVERSTDGGGTWSLILIDPPAHISSGAAPAPAICWLIGRGGVVLISTNSQPFVRVTPPSAADLASIRAISARDATVTTTDGRSFRTTDGGATWTPV